MTRIRAALLGIAATMGAAVPALAGGDSTLQLIYAYAHAGQLEQAERMINEVLAQNPLSARAHFIAAELALKADRLVIARSEFNQAEQLAPGLPFASAGAVQTLQAALGLRRAPEHTMNLASLEPSFPGVSGILLSGLGLLIWSIVRLRSGEG